MQTQKNPVKRYYTELEAAHTLSITMEALYEILDEHVFTPENPRPDAIELTYPELLLLSVWAKPERGHNVVEMPLRN